MIKEIHTFGTSFTAGGGHFFKIPEEILEIDSDLKQRVDFLHKAYSEEPKTMFHYSWPGQLQTLVKDGVKVFNHAKEGFGNERMYRITNDILWDENTFINCDDKIFLYEFSGLGRKEIWSNTIKDYCIINYGRMRKKDNGSQWVNVQQQYKVNNSEHHLKKDRKAWGKLTDFSKTYLSECMSEEQQLKKLEINNHMFIDSLLHHNVNFYSVGVEPEYSLENIKDKFMNFGGYNDFVDWALDKGGLTIWSIIKVKDKHLNLKGNKMVAEVVFGKLKKEGFDV